MINKRTSLILPYNQEGKILLQQRTDDAPHLPGYWSHFGGGIEADETPEEAAKREIKEELELDLGDIKIFKNYVIQQLGEIREKFVFLLPCDTAVEDLRKQLHEGQDLGYYSLEEIRKFKYPSWDIVIIEDVFKEIATRI